MRCRWLLHQDLGLSLRSIIFSDGQDLESKLVVDTLTADPIGTGSKAQQPNVISLAWTSDGQTLFAGYTDNAIRVWHVTA